MIGCAFASVLESTHHSSFRKPHSSNDNTAEIPEDPYLSLSNSSDHSNLVRVPGPPSPKHDRVLPLQIDEGMEEAYLRCCDCPYDVSSR